MPGWRSGNTAWSAKHQGRATTYGQIAAAIRKVIPAAAIELREGYDPAGLGHTIPRHTTRLRDDTGFAAACDEEHPAADYVGWLRSGNEQ